MTTLVGIERLRVMSDWFNFQDEGFAQKYTFNSLVKIFDYAEANNLEFMDSQYLYSDNLTESELKDALKFLSTLEILKP